MKILILLVLFLSQIAICNSKNPTKVEIYDMIKFYSVKHSLDPRVMIAQAYVESGLRIDAVNDQEKTKYKSRGLFQIQEPTAQHFCKLNAIQIMIPRKNIECAAIISEHLLKRFPGDEFQYIKMLFAYNAGNYYMCKKKPGHKCILGKPVNYSYLIKIIENYIKVYPELEMISITKYKSVNFLNLSKKYIDSL